MKRKGLGNPLLIASAIQASKSKNDSTPSLSTGTKVALGVGAAIVIVGGGYLIYRAITRTSTDKEGDGMSANLRNLTIKKSELTISGEQAMLIAQELLDAMNQRGTSENTVIKMLESVKSRADLLYIIKAFGIQNYGISGKSDSWFARWSGYATPLNLNGWLKKEFKEGSEYYKRIEAVYDRFNIPF